MQTLKVRFPSGDIVEYEGEDAKVVHDVIDFAGQRGSGWIVPGKLKNGYEVVFIISNISAFMWK